MDGRARLLVVDDDPDVLVVLRTKLEQTGRYEIATAGGGAEALSKARSFKPELIVTDIDMPDMDGGELVATLRDTPATEAIEIVFLSALVPPGDTERRSPSGVPMLSKRGSIQTLIRTIDGILANPRPRRASER
jgi:CheY-like chemotaxis protein